MVTIPEEKKLVLFDGVCNLCNTSVLRIIKYDTKNKFVFTSLQSSIGQEIIAHLQIDISKIDSIILYHPNTAYYIKSTAALKIMNDFGGFWKISQILFIFPKSVRDFFYNYIAKNRYKWFGKKESCMLPTADLASKFLK